MKKEGKVREVEETHISISMFSLSYKNLSHKDDILKMTNIRVRGMNGEGGR